MRLKTKFDWRLWAWTGPNEDLFDLDRGELDWFKRFVEEARK